MVKRRGDSAFRTFSEAYGTVSPSKFTNIRLLPGDEVLIDSPGGGGYGNPLERDRERVRRDVEEGFVSPEAAVERYGWKPEG
jgi:N-methylhydantoinase B/oxoprolinase/acetone carboxylase alpha subunit